MKKSSQTKIIGIPDRIPGVALFGPPSHDVLGKSKRKPYGGRKSTKGVPGIS